MTAQSVSLLGSDSTILGEVSSGSVGRAGVALTRGRFPKSMAWVDPNEDAVLAAQKGDRWLLAAADGHHGFDAARTAMSSIRARMSDVLADDRDGRSVLTALFEHARGQVAESLAAVEEARKDSRTALSVVLVRGREAFVATCGDSSVFLVRPRKVRSVTADSRFLGPRTPAPAVVRLRLRAGDGLAIVTDGFTDFLSQPVEMALGSQMAATDPAQAAQGLVQVAFAGGAGDNVGVVVLLPVDISRWHGRTRQRSA